MVQLLIDSKADMQASNNFRRTALHIASLRKSDNHDKRESIMRSLLQGGSDIDAKDCHGHTALVSAIKLAHLSDARFLLQQGANSEVRFNDVEDTLLIDAARSGWLNRVQMLLEHRADLGAENNCNETALMAAVQSDHKNSRNPNRPRCGIFCFDCYNRNLTALRCHAPQSLYC